MVENFLHPMIIRLIFCCSLFVAPFALSNPSTPSFPPVISQINPYFGGAQGGTIVTIEGANFAPNGLWSEIVVYFGNYECNIDRYHSTDSAIICTTPLCQTDACLSSESWGGIDWVSVSVFVTTSNGIRSASTSFMYAGYWTPSIWQMSHTTWATSISYVYANTYMTNLTQISISLKGTTARNVAVNSAQLGSSNTNLGTDGILNPETFFDYFYDKYIYYMPPDDIMAGYYNLTLTLINDGSGNFDSSTGIARMFTWHNPFFISAPWNSNNFDSTLLGTVFSLALFPAVTSVTPSAGSIAGGTLVTINGFGFSSLPLRLTVYVAGVLCDVQSANNNFITCVTRKSAVGDPQSLVSPYTNKFINGNLILNSTRSFGSPGWWVKMWDGIDYLSNRVGNDAYVKKSFGWRDRMYVSLYQLFGSSWPATLNFNSNLNYNYNFYIADIATTLVAPYTGYYTFYISVDDVGHLYMSHVGVGVSEILLATNPSFTQDGNFWAYKSQTSKSVSLYKGQRIYLRLRYVSVTGCL